MSVVLITGGSRGIGASAAENCARRGMGVILTYRSNRSAALSVLDRIASDGGQAVALELDVEDITGFVAFRAAVQRELHAKWGRTTLHGLVNNAGYGLFNPFETLTPTQFDGLLNVHLKGPFFLTQTLLPIMEEGASIVNVT